MNTIRPNVLALFCLAIGLTVAPSIRAADKADAQGPRHLWHPVTITFTGPQTGESANPNPFRDYRLDVAFMHESGQLVVVPGYYAADGDSGETGATAGNKWRVKFVPDHQGAWTYKASFRKGKDVALADAINAGDSAGHFDDATGRFIVGEAPPNATGFHAKGTLRYVGERYLRFAGTNEPFIKAGADSPENLLGYADFDGTYRHGKDAKIGKANTDKLHRYEPHVRDWKPGDPTWNGGKGKGLIGAMNYLASQGMNSVYFLTMNVTGDGKDVWPWTSHTERFRFDCSKLDQWEIVFAHMDKLGLQLHVVTQEQENDQLLDGGDLGPQRRLYHRELIARFGHHLAVEWNLGEENTNTDAQRKAFCDYIKRLDPYDHRIACHTFPGKYDQVYNPLLGHKTFDGPSLQTNDTHNQTLRWVLRSAAAGRQWVVCLDEIGPANTGVKPDKDDPGHDEVRRKHLWGNLMAGGAGVEWYFGYKYAHNDLNCEDWRSRANMWKQTRIAVEFFHKHLPFARMMPADQLTEAKDDYVLARPDDVYAVYQPRGGKLTLRVGHSASGYSLHWYNPRTGGDLIKGPLGVADKNGVVTFDDAPPGPEGQDWVAIVRAEAHAVELSTLRVNGRVWGRFPARSAVPINIATDPRTKLETWSVLKPGDAGKTVKIIDRQQTAATVIMPTHDVELVAILSTGPAPAKSNGPIIGTIDPNARVTGFTLINADTDKPVAGFDPIKPNAVIDTSKLGTRNLSLRANVRGRVAGVRFDLNGKRGVQTERVGPYSLTGDQDGNYAPWDLKAGQHTVRASVLGGGNKSGAVVSFTLR